MRSVYHCLAVGIAAALATSPTAAEDGSVGLGELLKFPGYAEYLNATASDSTIRAAIEAQLNPWRSSLVALLSDLKSRLRDMGSDELDRLATERALKFLGRYKSPQVAAERRSIPPEEFTRLLRAQAKINLLIESSIGKGIKAEKRQIDEASSALANLPPSQPVVLLEQLVFPIAPDEDPSRLSLVRAAADKAHTELTGSNGSFSKLAIEYAASPYFARYQKLPAIATDELTPELARALDGVAEGAISVPVRSSYGIHLARLIQRISPEPAASEAEIGEEALAIKLREAVARALREINSRKTS